MWLALLLLFAVMFASAILVIRYPSEVLKVIAACLVLAGVFSLSAVARLWFWNRKGRTS